MQLKNYHMVLKKVLSREAVSVQILIAERLEQNDQLEKNDSVEKCNNDNKPGLSNNPVGLNCY